MKIINKEMLLLHLEEKMLQTGDIAKIAEAVTNGDFDIDITKESDSEASIISKYEDHYFKRILGAYVHPDLKGLFESTDDEKKKIAVIKDKHRNSDEYKIGFKYFSIRQNEINGLKWHYKQLTSSFVGDVADQLKKFPTAVGYCCSLRKEIEDKDELIETLRSSNFELEQNMFAAQDQNHYFNLMSQYRDANYELLREIEEHKKNKLTNCKAIHEIL